eukprot:CAMPEP_0198730944 /NCGR_PEP_ID=MMETSP1475-20131203/27177_1 /TAXON_ID= ORGANISM="Unidentified sp., Strain CCMP1999" /NCGR_SAMPLE_ID=MMETSP1475 /ASSEMBLY_ACC=CAM_ASM_001111 /LENGTH=176 /DNA_ID=CAMNT_0044493837 /DNA_START=69 /DNA_END=599 /DNA_ORIENTATION=+
MTDVYFDDKICSLTRSDMWLRRRAVDDRTAVLELKVPLLKDSGATDVYREVIGPEEVAKVLGAPLGDGSTEKMGAAGLLPFAKILTKRTSVGINFDGRRFRVDLDEMDFGYTVGEIELLVESAVDVSAAEDAIYRFCTEHDIDMSPPNGKVLEFIRRSRPQHYQALEEAGILSRRS